jgi:hypothetical protein
MIAMPGMEALKPLKEKEKAIGMDTGVIRGNAWEFLIADRSPEN